MHLSAVSVLVVAQSSSEIPEGLMNNPVYLKSHSLLLLLITFFRDYPVPKNVINESLTPHSETHFRTEEVRSGHDICFL